MNFLTTEFDAEFLTVLIHSSTFWNTVMVWLSLSGLLILLSLLWIASRCRARWWQLWITDQRGAAGAVDMVLTLPIFIVIVMLVVQLGLLANGALIVHYAAYSAARSARVYHDNFVCAAYVMSKLDLCRDRQARYERVARFALIAAAPANASIRCRRSCEIPESILKTLVQASGHPEQRSDNFLKVAGLTFKPTPQNALLQKARYAFDASNSTVDIDIPSGAYLPLANNLWDKMNGKNGGMKSLINIPSALKSLETVTPVVRATVSFDLHMLMPVGRLIPGSQKRSYDGHYYKTATAEVTLL